MFFSIYFEILYVCVLFGTHALVLSRIQINSSESPAPNPNLNLILTWSLKPSLNPQTAEQNVLTFQKCPLSQGLKLKLVLSKTAVRVHAHTLYSFTVLDTSSSLVFEPG